MSVKGIPERDDDGEVIYVHHAKCPGFCDFACNGDKGNKLADAMRKQEMKTPPRFSVSRRQLRKERHEHGEQVRRVGPGK